MLSADHKNTLLCITMASPSFDINDIINYGKIAQKLTDASSELTGEDHEMCMKVIQRAFGSQKSGQSFDTGAIITLGALAESHSEQSKKKLQKTSAVEP